MARDIDTAVRELCLALPEAEPVVSHGSATFKVRGKTFAMFVVNHHGDGRVALWLSQPAGVQGELVSAEPRHFFVPPYVGPRGWLGVRVDQGIAWKRVSRLVREAYEHVAPAALSRHIGDRMTVAPPTRALAPERVDPLSSPAFKRLVQPLREYCLTLPETSEGLQFGWPVWRAGKKVFAQAYQYGPPLTFAFWVGALGQSLLTADPRYTIPAYLGHNGWIALAIGARPNRGEIRGLALGSYRHFALQRMLKALEPT